MSAEPPKEAFIICVDQEWPLDIVVSESHALAIKERRGEGAKRSHIYKVRIEVIDEMVATPPVAPRLVPKPTINLDDRDASTWQTR